MKSDREVCVCVCVYVCVCVSVCVCVCFIDSCNKRITPPELTGPTFIEDEIGRLLIKWFIMLR